MQNQNVLIFRSTLFLLGQILMTVVIATIGILTFPLPYRVRYRVITSWSYFIIWWAKVSCGIHYHIQGQEHLPKQTAIVLCKHQSAWETLFLQTLLPPQTWVLKKQLLQIPFFGWALRFIEPIAIDRNKSTSIKQLIEQGKERLTQGRWVVIFPEGSRISVGKTGKYSRSGSVLAKESKHPVVPIAHNAGVFWPRNAFLKYPGTIEVVIGPILDPNLLTADEIHEQTQRWIENTMKTLPQKSD